MANQGPDLTPKDYRTACQGCALRIFPRLPPGLQCASRKKKNAMATTLAPMPGGTTAHCRERLDALPREVLQTLHRGIEKESLRVRPDGTLATTAHPVALGSALKHPRITTDFSEAQLELITGVHSSAESCLKELTEIHQVVYRAIGDELLWGLSMPCRLPADDEIPIGRYGTSNIGRMKRVYRMGLSHRYGRRMQTISGIHYNFSLPDARSDDDYFALIRNFRRHSWLLLYLFGASPTVCSSFVAGRDHPLQSLSADTLYLPYATSLRMGRLGYQSDAQTSLAVSYNDLESYAASLEEAMTKPYPAYKAIGIRRGEEYRQLATSLLQMENEFYGTIRPKRVIRPGERPLHALRERGVEYVEVRLMDLEPFVPIGITAGTLRFLDVFLLHCLLCDSPPDTPDEDAAIIDNKLAVASRGREPRLRLNRDGEDVPMAEWAGEVLRDCAPIAAALDRAKGGNAHRDALAAAVAALADPDSTPSARVLEAVRRDYKSSYVAFALEQSRAHRAALTSLPFPTEVAERFARLAEESLEEQRRIEAADNVPFETFRQQYLAPVRLSE
jgi:glutamate--cysteine ligase